MRPMKEDKVALCHVEPFNHGQGSKPKGLKVKRESFKGVYIVRGSLGPVLADRLQERIVGNEGLTLAGGHGTSSF